MSAAARRAAESVATADALCTKAAAFAEGRSRPPRRGDRRLAAPTHRRHRHRPAPTHRGDYDDGRRTAETTTDAGQHAAAALKVAPRQAASLKGSARGAQKAADALHATKACDVKDAARHAKRGTGELTAPPSPPPRGGRAVVARGLLYIPYGVRHALAVPCCSVPCRAVPRRA